MTEFEERHQRLRNFYLNRFEQMKKLLLTDQFLSDERKLLVGAYFTQEYSLESAALFNPSMVWHLQRLKSKQWYDSLIKRKE